MTRSIKIGSRTIGQGYPTYIVAEISANHHQDIQKAKELILLAKKSGADAVKVQHYTPDSITLNSKKEYFQIGGGTLWDGKTLYDLYKEAYMPWEWMPELQKTASDIGIDIFSTPFDLTAVDYLEKCNVPAYKIASFEVVDIPLVRRVAQTGKPIIMSTGMASLKEIEEAIQAMHKEGNHQIALLKCTSSYPAPVDEANLRTIPHLADAFDVPVGLSDHTMGISVPVAAVSLGACMIEKHFTKSRSEPGPDSVFSLEPQELKEMIDSVRVAEKALGKISYQVTKNEIKSRVFRKSLFVAENIRKGELLSSKNIRSIRPANGIHPRYYDEVLGKTAICDIEKGTPLSWDLFI